MAESGIDPYIDIRDRISGQPMVQRVWHGDEAEKCLIELSALYQTFKTGQPIPEETKASYLKVLKELEGHIFTRWEYAASDLDGEGGYCDVGEAHLAHIERGGF